MKFKENKRIYLFALLVIIVMGVTIFNVFAINRIQNSTDLQSLQLQNELLKEDNIKLKDKLARVTPTAVEQARNQKIKAAKDFIEISFTREQSKYEERRKQAESIMGEELFSYFFPSKSYSLGNFHSLPKNIQLYLQNESIDEKKVSIIASFTTESYTTNEDVKDESHMTVQLTLQKDKDSWIIMQLQEISLEAL